MRCAHPSVRGESGDAPALTLVTAAGNVRMGGQLERIARSEILIRLDPLVQAHPHAPDGRSAPPSRSAGARDLGDNKKANL